MVIGSSSRGTYSGGVVVAKGWLGPKGGSSTSFLKCQTAGLWRRFIKKELDIMRFRLYEVNFDLTCKGLQNTSTHILLIF